ncbi:MAG TPA: hypothetical protein VFI90_12715 [Rubrobacter sp.]|nr:hypothetical protein [Rubrobacter sp.]
MMEFKIDPDRYAGMSKEEAEAQMEGIGAGLSTKTPEPWQPSGL